MVSQERQKRLTLGPLTFGYLRCGGPVSIKAVKVEWRRYILGASLKIYAEDAT